MFNIQRITIGLGRRIFIRQLNGSPTSAATKALESSNDSKSDDQKNVTSVPAGLAIPKDTISKSKNSLVAAAFESLRNETDDISIENNTILVPEIDDRINNAKTVNGLLTISEIHGPLDRKEALKIVSILAEWSTIKRAKLSDFENDPRFIKLCRVLGRSVVKSKDTNVVVDKVTKFRTDDLNTVLGVAGDDEAAKLVASISLNQMVKVMSQLAQKKRRSTPLLRALAHNISSNTDSLNLKECADLLYAMAVLNFPDAVLIARIGIDIQTGLTMNTNRPAAVGSIITSLGLLKFRDCDVLENLVDWIINHHEICRPQDISSLFLTLATLNYPISNSEQLKTKLVNSVTQRDFQKQIDWLNHVWALVVLDFATPAHIKSILESEFLQSLAAERGPELSPTIKMKILNINAASKHLITDFKGPQLPTNSPIYNLQLVSNKNKQVLVAALLDSLKSLFSTPTYVRANHDTKMGFTIDAECVLDNKLNPLSVDKEHKNATRLAMMVLDFHDMCQGASQQPTGITTLSHRLLQSIGYKVLIVPYNEFNASEKLLKRVQYLESKIKSIVNSK